MGCCCVLELWLLLRHTLDKMATDSSSPPTAVSVYLCLPLSNTYPIQGFPQNSRVKWCLLKMKEILRFCYFLYTTSKEETENYTLPFFSDNPAYSMAFYTLGICCTGAMYMYVHVKAYTCMYMHVRTCTCMCIHMYMYVRIYIRICMFVSL